MSYGSARGQGGGDKAGENGKIYGGVEEFTWQFGNGSTAIRGTPIYGPLITVEQLFCMCQFFTGIV